MDDQCVVASEFLRIGDPWHLGDRFPTMEWGNSILSSRAAENKFPIARYHYFEVKLMMMYKD